MATAALNRYTPEEYLALERNAEFKSEYIDGRIIATTPGAARPHILVVSALVREIDPRTLDRSCEVYSNDMRVKVSASGDYVYPDVVVACDPQFEDEAFDTLLNPVLIIEVLSDSTERHDRGVKFSLYRRIESLQEYVLLSQKEMLAERYVRQGDFWQFSSIDGLDAALELASIDVQIPLERIYLYTRRSLQLGEYRGLKTRPNRKTRHRTKSHASPDPCIQYGQRPPGPHASGGPLVRRWACGLPHSGFRLAAGRGEIERGIRPPSPIHLLRPMLIGG